MADAIWVVPCGAAPDAVQLVMTAVSDRSLSPKLLTGATQHGGHRDARPRAAVIVGGALDSALLAALRRLTDRRVPTLVLVTGLSEHHELLLLTAGAFDVVGLPTTEARVGGRIGALHRNAGTLLQDDVEEVLRLPFDISLSPARREVRVGDQNLALTRTEFDLLRMLARDPRQVVSRRELGETFQKSASPRSIESHMSRLRSKLMSAGAPRLVVSVRGVGYRLLP